MSNLIWVIFVFYLIHKIKKLENQSTQNNISKSESESVINKSFKGKYY